MVSQDHDAAAIPVSSPMLLSLDWLAPTMHTDKEQQQKGEEELPGISSQSATASTRAESQEDVCERPWSSADRSAYSPCSQPVKIDPLTLQLGMPTELLGESICNSTWAKAEPQKKGCRVLLEAASEPMWLQLPAPDLGVAETHEAPARVRLFCHWCGSKRASKISMFCTSCGTQLT